MDTIGANRIIDAVIGREVGGWRVVAHIGTGKSAVVFKAINGGALAALKIFDPDLVARSGEEAQLARINRELRLKDKEHPNLVRILDGGKCLLTGHLYVVMALIDAPNLASVLDAVPRDRIKPILSQVALAARFLEDLDIVHRDIKTDNIAISKDFETAILLDLGVIRPLDLTDTTSPSSDGERRSFVGTLRYSPPELAFRYEEHTPEGWRAVTFYQLGGVLHDLIMRKRLFEDQSDPYPRLVKAVANIHPHIEASDVPQELILLARNCLLKDAQQRVRYVTWSDFEVQLTPVPAGITARERIRRRFALSEQGEESDDRAREQRERERQRIVQQVQSELRAVLTSEFTGKDYVPLFTMSEHQHEATDYLAICFDPSPRLNLPHSLTVWFSIAIIDASSRVVAIQYCAAVHDAEPAMATVASRVKERLFEGAYQEQTVQQRLIDVLYTLIDAAQQNPVVANDVSWLTLTSGGSNE